MEESISSEELHYRRGIHFVNKLIKNFSGRIDDDKVENEFSIKEFLRFKSTGISKFDLSNFLFLCTVSLVGMNKEAIEKSEKNKDYKFKINHNIIEDFIERNYLRKRTPEEIKNLSIGELEFVNMIAREIDKFKSTRKIESEFDGWLSINSVKNVDNTNYNYLFNVRNSLMHSEYNFDYIKNHAFYIANLNNSNYTGFKATLFVLEYYEFIKHYFSNDGLHGIVENCYRIGLKDKNKSIENEDDIIDFLTKEAGVLKYEYENKLKAKKIYEKTLLSIENEKLITEYDRKRKNINIVECNLDSNQIAQIICVIKEYFGDDFYKLSDMEKVYRLSSAIKYIIDPKAVFSSWIMHYYDLVKYMGKGMVVPTYIDSVFAKKPSLLILKSYLILYRLQNKELQKYPIDYDQMCDVKFDYESNYYEEYKNKLSNKKIILPEEEYKKNYFIEVFRDSLAHGNIKSVYTNENDKIIHNLQFSDVWKNKTRTITISVDELEKFLNSDCFDPKNMHLEESKGIAM